MPVWTQGDYLVLIDVSKACRFNPEDALAVMTYESGLHAGAQNSATLARGLNQMMPSTLRNLGYKPGDPDYNASDGNYTRVPIAGQIRWFGKYLDQWRKIAKIEKWENATQLYVCNFAPAHIPFATQPAHIIFSRDKHPKEYGGNKGLDRDRKGWIAVGDLTRAIQEGMSWGVYKRAIEALKAAESPPPEAA